jgi:hypothetical protein
MAISGSSSGSWSSHTTRSAAAAHVAGSTPAGLSRAARYAGPAVSGSAAGVVANAHIATNATCTATAVATGIRHRGPGSRESGSSTSASVVTGTIIAPARSANHNPQARSTAGPVGMSRTRHGTGLPSALATQAPTTTATRQPSGRLHATATAAGAEPATPS